MEETDSSDGLCRLCASLFFSKSGFFIFGDDQITNKIELYLQIQMVRDDYLPKNICSNCLSKIEAFHEFAENARKIQHSFHAYNESTVYEVQEDENISNTMETLEKIDSSYQLFAKEEQNFNLSGKNFEPIFNKVSCHNDDSFLNFFPSNTITTQNFSPKVPTNENNNQVMSKLEEQTNDKNIQESSYTSIIKPIDMKHLTTPSNNQPNLFNIPNTQSNLFTTHTSTSSPIVLDCSYSDDVMSNSYLDISAYPDMCEIEDITINYKNNIKFEMGKNVSDVPPSFDISDATFDTACIGIPSTEAPLHEQNDYFTNFEYKIKDAIKYPDFDIIKEMNLNLSGKQTPSTGNTINEHLKDQRTPVNIEMTNEAQVDVNKSTPSTPVPNENKILLPSLQNNFTTMFESWNNESPAQLNQTESRSLQEQSEDRREITSINVNEAITYDVIYLGDDIYGSNTTDTNVKPLEVTNVNGKTKESVNSVLRSRLLNSQKKNSEVQQVITLLEDTNQVRNPQVESVRMINTSKIASFSESEINPPTNKHSINKTNDTIFSKPVPTGSTLTGAVTKTPTIQCKSLDKIIKDMKIAQPSIQCKSLDKIIKDMKIANRLSKLNKPNVKPSANVTRISSNNQATFPSNHNFSEQNKKLSNNNVPKESPTFNTNDTIKGLNVQTENMPEDPSENVDKNNGREIRVENTKENFVEITEVVEEPFEMNLVRTGMNSYTVVNPTDKDMTSSNAEGYDGSKSNAVNQPQLSTDIIANKIPNGPENTLNIDKAKCIKEQITDLRKPNSNNKCESNMNDKTTDKMDGQKQQGGKDGEDKSEYKPDDSWKHIKCNKCLKVYEAKSKFDEHYKSAHNESPVYTCLCCNKSTGFYATFKSHCYRRANMNRYSSKTCVETHIKAVHLKLGTQKCVCEFCGTMFMSRAQLNSHLPCQQVDCSVFLCQTCGKIFSTSAGMKQHVRRIHTTETYICDICAKSFHMKFNLAQHIKTHASSRPFVCPHCGHSYYERSHLKRHMKKHITSREYTCGACPKSFKSEELRRLHEKTHVLCRPLQCEFCAKSFLTVTKLKEHNNIHTGLRPYTCKFCDLSFSNYPNWHKHMKRKHPDFPYTSRKVALSGGTQNSDKDVTSSQPVEEIAQESSLLLDISSNTVDKEHFQYTTPSNKLNSLDIVLDSGNSNSSSCNIYMYTSSMNDFHTTEYSFHQF
ncbi:hypothetical protein M8J75_002666 [Diaphorina citri]|nr:hypothetical protein M8J75_002666 [Diaphorina citri]